MTIKEAITNAELAKREYDEAHAKLDTAKHAYGAAVNSLVKAIIADKEGK